MFVFAIFADTANQALCLDEVYAGGDKKGFDAHIHQEGTSGGSIIRVERGKNKVAGERGFDGNFSRFKVADLTHKNDVGILAQERSEGSREVQADLFLHLHLIDTGKVELDRVFRGHDVRLDLVQRLESRVERVCLTTSGWSSHQDHTVRLRDVSLKLDERFRLETELGHVEHEVLFVQQAEHDFFAKQSRKSRDAEVELTRTRVDSHFDLDTAVLRQTLL